MATQQQVLDKVSKMMADVTQAVLKRCEEKLHGGAVDLETYENNFRLPKILLTSALHDVADMYRPLAPADQKTLKNLSHV